MKLSELCFRKTILVTMWQGPLVGKRFEAREQKAATDIQLVEDKGLNNNTVGEIKRRNANKVKWGRQKGAKSNSVFIYFRLYISPSLTPISFLKNEL